MTSGDGTQPDPGPLSDLSPLESLNPETADYSELLEAVGSGRGCLSPGWMLYVATAALSFAVGMWTLSWYFDWGDASLPAADLAAVSESAEQFSALAIDQARGFTAPAIGPTESPVPTSSTTTTPAALAPVLSSGSWQIVSFEGQTDCDGLIITVPRSDPKIGELALLEDGRLLMSGLSEDEADVLLELDEDAPEPRTYVGAIAPQDAVEGVDFVFTVVFDSDEHATTHIGGTLTSGGVTCTIDRSGEATFVG